MKQVQWAPQERERERITYMSGLLNGCNEYADSYLSPGGHSASGQFVWGHHGWEICASHMLSHDGSQLEHVPVNLSVIKTSSWLVLIEFDHCECSCPYASMLIVGYISLSEAMSVPNSLSSDISIEVMNKTIDVLVYRDTVRVAISSKWSCVCLSMHNSYNYYWVYIKSNLIQWEVEAVFQSVWRLQRNHLRLPVLSLMIIDYGVDHDKTIKDHANRPSRQWDN